MLKKRHGTAKKEVLRKIYNVKELESMKSMKREVKSIFIH